ncbi:hypothetical protein GCM10010329_65600 [Streptomyces spiroverticillatus]|uniref:Uncharacterized protein n=1 Tax=Streptomyces finlayi TaxID=67296 RepID=A0A918X4H8_9ACTN|nr:hypothetical protein [Streptomyces finlayi]GHA33439.1 hypothetical protein GCM10010329_65600 [Streptomyces spiroverticillatus]GHD11263.1 hypothetical protein GCM10010334_67160 [Streptomyces finlayi]
MRHRVRLGAAAALVLAASGWATYTSYAPQPSSVESLTLYDPTDLREVAGSAENVFHAGVIRRTGHRSLGGLEQELYEVRVDRNFKGRLTGVVTVTQSPGEDAPLTPGESYVFATAAWDGGAGHAVLSGTKPHPAPDLGAAAGRATDRAAGGAGRGLTVAERWLWAVAHQVDVTKQPLTPATGTSPSARPMQSPRA